MSSIITDLNLAISHLNKNDVVAIPTETVYGLAANALSEEAIHKIFKIKNRPLNHPLIMHVSAKADLTQWVSFIPDYAKKLINHFWPGPLTLVLSCKKGVLNPLVNGGQDSVAIRAPKHPLAEKLLDALSFPLVAPSANPFGKISPTTALHVQESFENDDLLILEGGRCDVGIESTIVDAREPHQYKILRHGLIHEDEIKNLLDKAPLEEESALRVSGHLKDHYQPEKPLFAFNSPSELKELATKGKLYVLAFQALSETYANHFYQFSSDAKEVAFDLYYQLRIADKAEVDYLAIELPPQQKQWFGIRERILKAVQK
ncbi:MAG: threonylcarbamoyl-AMP synthase [Proteobacteria bacterium]|nr:threonylcarbamoyl-AMP synthase [Pseudomonadota bacterium]